MSTSAAPSTSSANSSREILSSSLLVAQRLREAVACPSLPILHRSQWRCLATTYCAVIQALIALFERACSLLKPLEQDIMFCSLTVPLYALHQAVQEGETCMQESLPSSSSSTHLWLVEKALKLGMSTDVVDLHLHDLLWTSSVVREQILRSSQIHGMELISNQTTHLCEIWATVDAEDDFLSAQDLLKRIIGEEEGETQQLASFILQKLSCAENSGHKMHSDDLPPFLWVDPEGLKRNPDVLGQGGYGKVHEALWLGGHFAVKDFFSIETKVFGREATIQAQLRHPNVIPLVCCTKNSRKCSLVMELMQQDLQTLMMQRIEAGMDCPFPLLLAVDLMLQIAKGMEYLHSDSLRIIHRDLKSSNILVNFPNMAGVSSSYTNDVSPHVHLKIADFGMPKAKHASSTYTTRPAGTTAWRAPEVFEGNSPYEVECGHPNAKYTNKADVYSFGMVCYEILTGKIPFEGTQIQRRVLAGERPMLPLHCPLALSSYIEKCWHPEPAQRPTFTQICRILRYFKACILLQDHDQDHKAADYHNCLLHPLSTTMCACIDDMLLSLAQQFGATLRPQLLVIPLEMYCCKEVLQQFSLEDQLRSGVGLEKSSQTAKGYFNGMLQWGKMKGTQIANSELGKFTYEELCVATNNFHSVVEGGGSAVYCGTLADGRRVAVKLAHPCGRGVSPQILIEELRIASQHSHGNIVPLLGWSQNRENFLLVYEYMPNDDLEWHIFQEEESVFGWHQRYKVVCQLAAALKYLHQDSGYMQVHTDVKTSNVLLDSQWNARLGDCGLALTIKGTVRSVAPETDFGEYTVLAGTIGFIAPEALLERTVSQASDIFSFGVTILEIATGRRAYHGLYIDHLVNWVWELYQVGEVMQAADARLEGNFDEMEMERVLVLGLVCTNVDPQARPSMEEVLMILSRASEPRSPKARPLPLYGAAVSRLPQLYGAAVSSLPQYGDPFSSSSLPSDRSSWEYGDAFSPATCSPSRSSCGSPDHLSSPR